MKISYPKDEDISADGQALVTRRTAMQNNLSGNDIVDIYRDLLKQGYAMNITIKTPKEVDHKHKDEEKTPFDVAEDLTKNDIKYKATLKINTTGAYQLPLNKFRGL